jgi:hypothetical protein
MNIRKLIQTPNEEEYLYALALRAFGTGPEAEQANEEMKELMATWRPAKRRRMARLFRDWALEFEIDMYIILEPRSIHENN